MIHPFLFSLLLACLGSPESSEAPVVDPPAVAAPAPMPPTPPEAPEAPPAEATALSVGCPSELVAHFNALVQSGCELKTVDDALPMIPRVLRNVPFAARGYRFKSDELTTFFTACKQGCPEAWYKPTGADFELPADEQACVTKLKAHEATLRKTLDVPKAVESYALTQLTGEVLSEIERHRGLKTDGDRVIVTQTDGAWSLNFYSEDTYEGEMFESSSIVSCDADDVCQTMFAG